MVHFMLTVNELQRPGVQTTCRLIKRMLFFFWRFEVLTVVLLKIQVLRYVEVCHCVGSYRMFQRTVLSLSAGSSLTPKMKVPQFCWPHNAT